MIDPTTKAALAARQRTTQCALAKELGEPVATISDILALRHAHVSLKTENRIRQKLGLERLRPPIELLPNEKIVKLRPLHKRDKRRCVHLSAATYAEFEHLRQGYTQDEFVRLLLAQITGYVQPVETRVTPRFSSFFDLPLGEEATGE